MTPAQQNKVNDVSIAVANSGGRVAYIHESGGAGPVVIMKLVWRMPPDPAVANAFATAVEKAVVVFPNGVAL